MREKDNYTGSALRRWNSHVNEALLKLFPRDLNLHTTEDPATLATIVAWRKMMIRGASPLEYIQELMPGSHKIEDIFWRLNEDPATAQQRSLLSVETKNAWARTCRNL